jgi:predicted DCC family thiol-disulfide oxidoreductase YuxK
LNIKTKREHIKIIIFDGVCLLCNSAVYFLHKRLRYQNYKFIPSQSESGETYITKYNLDKIFIESIVLVKEEEIYIKSDAILEIIGDMSYLWSLLNIFRVVPRTLRNWFYDRLSKNRHLLFGKNS